jgi:hypothetical protein
MQNVPLEMWREREIIISLSAPFVQGSAPALNKCLLLCARALDRSVMGHTRAKPSRLTPALRIMYSPSYVVTPLAVPAFSSGDKHFNSLKKQMIIATDGDFVRMKGNPLCKNRITHNNATAKDSSTNNSTALTRLLEWIFHSKTFSMSYYVHAYKSILRQVLTNCITKIQKLC